MPPDGAASLGLARAWTQLYALVRRGQKVDQYPESVMLTNCDSTHRMGAGYCVWLRVFILFTNHVRSLVIRIRGPFRRFTGKQSSFWTAYLSHSPPAVSWLPQWFGWLGPYLLPVCTLAASGLCLYFGQCHTFWCLGPVSAVPGSVACTFDALDPFPAVPGSV